MSTGLQSVLAPMSGAEFGSFAARSAVALALGAAIGLERQWRQRGAGLRTNALVAVGACFFELFAVTLTDEHGTDPSRIAAYVVSGVGFLGGGVILRQGGSITGINTAATIWCSAAVGTLAGAVCRSSDEAHIRVLVVQALTKGPFHLRALQSKDIDLGGATVEVVADVVCFGREDVELENVVSRLSMEPSVTSVRWSILEDQTENELEGVVG